ncbi:MAG TPA: hypothetical protein VF573_17390 [Paraburkholderia sp.]|uniref:hypothetical protein n=1 Tax=Paraburkholderia sp. TaxID=1926495 RepID=UPI002ED21A2F
MNDSIKKNMEKKKVGKTPKFRLPWPGLDRVSTAMKMLFQIAATAGGAFLLIYCVEVGHYPTGATIADVLLLLATSIAATTVYSILVGTLYGSGLIVALPVRLLFNRKFVHLINHEQSAKNYSEHQTKPAHIPNFGFEEWLLCVCCLLLVVLLVLHFWTKPIALLALASSIVVCGILRATIAMVRVSTKHDQRSKRDFVVVLFGIIFFAPVYTGLLAQLDILPVSLRSIGVRKENVTVFVAKQRAVLIDDALPGRPAPRILGDYHKYENAQLLMRGIGNESVIEIAGRRWVIPNDQFVVSYPGKAEAQPSPAKP